MPVNLFSFLKEFQSSLKVNLVFVETTGLRSVGKAPFHTQDVFVPLSRIVHVLGQIIEKFFERKLTSFTAHVVIQSRFE